MSFHERLPLIPLPRLLALDAGLCLAMAALLLPLAGPIASLTGLPPVLIRIAGLMLLPSAALMAATAAGWIPARIGVPVVLLGNLLWALASLLLLAMLPLTLSGIGLVVLQAVVVLALALAERDAARRRGLA